MDDWFNIDMLALERKQLNTLTTNYNHRAEQFICTNYHSLWWNQDSTLMKSFCTVFSYRQYNFDVVCRLVFISHKEHWQKNTENLGNYIVLCTHWVDTMHIIIIRLESEENLLKRLNAKTFQTPNEPWKRFVWAIEWSLFNRSRHIIKDNNNCCDPDTAYGKKNNVVVLPGVAARLHSVITK